MENPDMDSSLWGHLPENLIDLVLARLPAVNLLRFRTVCKKWKDLITTKYFTAAWSQAASYEPYLVLAEHGGLLMCYDRSIPRWYRVSLEYIPFEVGIPVSSAGGLICFINNWPAYLRDGPMLFVTNPLTKTWKELPPSPCEPNSIKVVSLIIWKQPAHYKVIVVTSEGVTQIYDSVNAAWHNTVCLRCEELFNNEMNVDNMAAFCNGSLYLLTSSNRALMAFSMQDEVWSQVKTDRLPGHRKFRNLVTCNGHIVIVGKSKRQQVVSMRVWYLDWHTMKWLEAGCMPQHMLTNFLRYSYSVLQLSSYGDSILLNSIQCDLSYLFNMAKGTWNLAEYWPNNCDGIVFEPRLDSQV